MNTSRTMIASAISDRQRRERVAAEREDEADSASTTMWPAVMLANNRIASANGFVSFRRSRSAS